MAGKVCGDYYQQLLNQTVGGGSGVTYYLRLYSNNHTPVLNESPGNFTEVTASGYAAVTLSGGSWSIVNTSGVLVATYPQQTFNLTAAVNIYGYYITDSGKTKVYWAELFAGGPIAYGSGGGAFLLSLELDGPTS